MGPRGFHQSAAWRENRSTSATSTLEMRAFLVTMQTISLFGRWLLLQRGAPAGMYTRLFRPARGLRAGRLLAPFGASGNVMAPVVGKIRGDAGGGSSATTHV